MDVTDYASVVVTGSGVPPVTLYHSGLGNRYYFTGSRLVLHEDHSQSGVAPNLQVQYNRARWYDPALGRWLQRDPAEYVDGMNLYEYVRGRPLNLLDSSGTCTVGSTCYSFESAVVSGFGGPNVNRLLVAFTVSFIR